VRKQAIRFLDDDKLEVKHWRSTLQVVEIWENERFDTTTSVWSKDALRESERKGWTRGRDGWSGSNADGSDSISNNLEISLPEGWAFVETEDWRKDLDASWTDIESDADDGWVYSNDSWLMSGMSKVKASAGSGVTRRRRWTRRIYEVLQ